MKKMTKSSLKKSADTLISMTTRMIGELEAQESCEAKDLERLSVAFAHALSAVSSMEKSPARTKKTAKAEEKKEAVGKICLPPVMEREK